MSWSRWKLMAGVLSVSLGGLATVAGQCPKTDTNKGAKNPIEVAMADPPVAPGIPPAPAAKMPPAAPVLPIPQPIDLPASPMIPAGPAVPPPSPAALPTPPAFELPSLSAPSPVPLPSPTVPAALPEKAGGLPVPMPHVVPASGVNTPPAPMAPGSLEGNTSNKTDKPNPTQPMPAVQPPTTPTGFEGLSGGVGLPVPAVQPPAHAGNPPVFTPPSVVTPSAPPAPKVAAEVDPLIPPTAVHPVVPVSNVTTSATKFRIVLRVGEGEPTFEVRSGDDLLLKVICEKVDISSPEKGTGPSTIKASGKVRFTGFGAEGTCDHLAFLAGTGEVDMTGGVKIHVKDKLGRVESELSTETMKYKIDPSATGSLKP